MNDDRAQPPSTQHRSLGATTAIALVVATMIGTGVFTTSGFLLANLPSPAAVLAVWAVGGVIAALGALCYGALARRIPESGGEYVFLSRTVHPAAGYIAGWVSLVVGFAAPTAASAFAFGNYVAAWTPSAPPKLTGGLVIILFSALHAAHVRRGAWTQNLGVALNLVLILGFAVWALPRLELPGHLSLADSPPSFSALAFSSSLILVSYSYSGWNAAIYIAGEIDQPARNLPRALFGGSLLVTVLYLALNAVFVWAAPPAELAGKVDIGRIAAERIGGPAWGNAVTALIALVLMMSVSSLLMAGPRISARMAADGYLPRSFAPTSGAPRLAVAAQALIALALLVTATFEGLLMYVGMTLSLVTGATVFGLVLLRRKVGAEFSVPGWPWVPILFLIAVGWSCLATAYQRPLAAGASLGTLVLGWLAWRVLARKSGNASGMPHAS